MGIFDDLADMFDDAVDAISDAVESVKETVNDIVGRLPGDTTVDLPYPITRKPDLKPDLDVKGE